MKKILMIGTGGTIASEMTPEGLTPELNTHQLLAYLPRIAQLCHVDCIQLYSLDSTSIHPTHWLGTAQAIREHYDDYDGFVISHGTDTMAYTAAALSYLVQDSPKPIILTGAQKPIWFDGTDSKRNLTDAFLYACRGCGGVQIVFNGRVILGTRARKTYSKSFRAFSSVNYPDLAVVQDEHLLQYIRCDSRPRPLFYDRLDPHVGLLKLIPGTEDALAEFMLDRYDGLIIESFGVGGLPEYDGGHLYDVVRRGVERGKIVVMTTQLPGPLCLRCIILSPLLIYPPRLNLYHLCRLPMKGRRYFSSYMKMSHAFYENHAFYISLFLCYTKTISEGFRYISLRVP